MFDLISSFIESCRNPGWVRFAFYIILAAGGASFLALFSKTSILGYETIKAGYSKEARDTRVNLRYLSYVLFVISILFMILGLTSMGDNDFFAEKEIAKEEDKKTKDELTRKGGYGDLPIIRIRRNCFDRDSHEYENYTLFAGSFDYEENAIRLVSTLDRYNIRDANFYPLQCDSIKMVGGKYFVFLGRKCQTLKSVQQYEQKYETMFREEDYVDLKIVKFVEE